MKKAALLLITLTGCTSVTIPTKDHEDLVGIGDHFSQAFSVDSTATEIERLFRHKKDFNFKQGTLLVEKSGEKLNMTLQTDEATWSRKFKCQPNGKLTTPWAIGLVPPLLWTIKSQTNIISRDKQGHLVLYQDSGGLVMLTIVPVFGSSNGQTRTVYELREE